MGGVEGSGVDALETDTSELFRKASDGSSSQCQVSLGGPDRRDVAL
jgi:hypothetical protein